MKAKSRLDKRTQQFIGFPQEALTKSKTPIKKIHNLIKINLMNNNNI